MTPLIQASMNIYDIPHPHQKHKKVNWIKILQLHIAKCYQWQWNDEKTKTIFVGIKFRV
jgi:hypothetical protein